MQVYLKANSASKDSNTINYPLFHDAFYFNQMTLLLIH